jgi:hypothetical protein
MAKAQSDVPRGRRAPSSRSDRLALLVFAGVLAIALVLYLVLAHDQWFFLDEWDFLVLRRASSLDDLFRPHNEHWTTLPILAYRGLHHLFDERTYVPYQVVSITLHLCVAALLLVVIRRSRVNPWIATAAASLFALFGAGSEDIVWAFQMAFTAALIFGLIHLLLADHDGPVDRRDALGLAAGLLGLLCSGVAVTMVIVVGIAVLVRRGWRRALLHTAPLAVVYLTWWLLMARDAYTAANLDVSNATRFVLTGVGATFDSLGQVPGVGVLVGIALVLGLAMAWAHLAVQELRQRAAVPGAMLVGAVVFLAIAALGRGAAFGPDFARSGRYQHVVAALTLPSVAVAADALVRRWRASVPIVAVLLVIGIPGNIQALADYRVPPHEAPDWVHVRRTLVQSERVGGAECETLGTAVVRELAAGESLIVRGDPVRVGDARGGTFYDFAVYDPADGRRLTARSPISLRLTRDDRQGRSEICSPTR